MILQLVAMAGGRLAAGARCTASCELHLRPRRLLGLAWRSSDGTHRRLRTCDIGAKGTTPSLLPRARLRVLHLLHPCCSMADTGRKVCLAADVHGLDRARST